MRGRDTQLPSASMSRQTSSNIAEMECEDDSSIQPNGGEVDSLGPTTSSTSRNKKKKKKKKNAANKSDSTAPPPPLPTYPTPLSQVPNLGAASLQQGFSPLSRYPPPKCCPPDRCTGVGPEFSVWAELDGLLYETCLAGFKCKSSSSALFLTMC